VKTGKAAVTGELGVTPHEATRTSGPTGVLATACLHTEIRRNTGSPEWRVAGTRPDAREGQAGPLGVAEGFVVCAGQRFDPEGSSPSAARMRGGVSKDGGNASSAGELDHGEP